MRRRLAQAATALLLLTACSREVSLPDESAPVATTAPPDGAPAEPAPPTTNAPGQPAPTSAGGRPRPTQPPATSAPTDSRGGVPRNAGDGPPGSFARTLLRPEPATRIEIVVLVAEGADPLASTLTALREEVEAATRKPVSTGATVRIGPSGGETSADEIRRLARDRGRTSGGDTAVVNVLFLGGGSAEGDGVLGVAVEGDVFAVFTDKVRETASPFVTRAVLEEAVTVHELGHLLGLVDLARDTDRADPEHPGHSRNTASVMYWAVESSLVGQVLGGPPPRDFDDDDRADFTALRAGG